MSAARLPSFVLGYHGTDNSVVEAVLSGNEPDLKRSDNNYDWLGSGLYFWENSHGRAMDWAARFKDKPRKGGHIIRTPAVIGAIIDLGHCLNLLDHSAITLVKSRHAYVVAQCLAEGLPIPKNENPTLSSKSTDKVYRKLDCAVIENIHKMVELGHKANPDIQPYDSVRAVFLEGDPVYEDSGFLEKTHIQICVRNPKRIIGYFRPR